MKKIFFSTFILLALMPACKPHDFTVVSSLKNSATISADEIDAIFSKFTYTITLANYSNVESVSLSDARYAALFLGSGTCSIYSNVNFESDTIYLNGANRPLVIEVNIAPPIEHNCDNNASLYVELDLEDIKIRVTKTDGTTQTLESTGTLTNTYIIASASSTPTPTPTPTPSPTPKVIFLSATTNGGNLGGVTGADGICQADANRPSTSKTYKALLTDASTRIACTTANCSGGSSEHTNWVLAASTSYVTSTGTALGTTTSAGIFDLSTGFSNALSSSTDKVWTGLNSNWTSSTDHCTAWTLTSAIVNSKLGKPSATNADFISETQANCFPARPLYCVEQ